MSHMIFVVVVVFVFLFIGWSSTETSVSPSQYFCFYRDLPRCFKKNYAQISRFANNNNNNKALNIVILKFGGHAVKAAVSTSVIQVNTFLIQVRY